MASDLHDSHRLFKAFADPTRLRMLHLLGDGELCVCHLMEVLQLPQSTVSRHLAYLRRVGLVDAREEGTWNHYQLTKPATKLHRALLHCMASCLGGIGQLEHDRKALKRLPARA